MRTLTALALIVALAFALTPLPAGANMPPPEPFRLGIAGKLNADGFLLTSVAKDSKADQHGLKPGDIILAADHIYAKAMSVNEQKDFADGLHVWHVELVVLRGGRDVIVVEIRA